MERALCFWDDNTYYAISLKTVERPRKETHEYAIGDQILCKIPGFPGKHNGTIIAISEDNKYLQRLKKQKLEEAEATESSSTEPETHPDPPTKRRRTAKPVNKEANTTSKEKEKVEKEKRKIAEKTSKEKEKADKEKRKLDAEKKKNEEIRRNTSFLQSLEAFKDQNITITPGPHQELPVPLLPLQTDNGQIFMKPNRPRAVFQTNDVLLPTHSEFSPPQYMDLGEMPAIHVPPKRRQPETTPVSRVLNDVRDILHSTADQENFDQCFNVACVGVLDEVRSLREELVKADNRCRVVSEQLRKAKEEIQQLKNENIRTDENASAMKRQADGRPRAGLVPQTVARNYHMIELLPGTGVYVYPKHIKMAQKKIKGTQVARYLMSVFYTNSELVSLGNLSGVHGKEGMDPTIAGAIVDYAVAIHGKASVPEVKYSMRTKISALVSLEKKKTAEIFL
ncbi:caldesmon-like isoform X2 [Argopecten irradians]|uniref:caldesmon-like isoform X2 n=1 Tax=Argopecten irradians TaxID=31199 RepID=UPI00371457EC